MDYYVALIHKESGSDFGVSFPDLPGCVTAGKSYEEALRLAGEALAFHVDGLRADGDKVPAPRSLTAIEAAKENWIRFKGATIALIPLLPTPAGKPQPTNLSLDAGLVDAVDRYAEKVNLTRSAVFAEGAKLLIQSRPADGKTFLAGRVAATGDFRARSKDLPPPRGGRADRTARDSRPKTKQRV